MGSKGFKDIKVSNFTSGIQGVQYAMFYNKNCVV